MWNFEDVLEAMLRDPHVFILPEELHDGVANRVRICVLSSNHRGNRGNDLQSVPTHTEDGILIRKLHVSNLPPETSETELLGVFAQYGCIKSCHLQMRGRYAFVTFINPTDAHRALMASYQKVMLQGYRLKTSPADSWHQPVEDADGQVRWKPTNRQYGRILKFLLFFIHFIINAEEKETYTILDILNWDCLAHVLSFVPIIDLIRSERVSKRWQCMVQEHYNSTRLFKTSWWQHGTVTLTTLVLRRVLQRLGPNLKRLHIDKTFPALNDRTPHTVGKFCPNLEELKVFGMDTENWNPVTSGCKFLKAVSFLSCSEVSDTSLQQMMNIKKTSIESITVAENRQVTGMFLMFLSGSETLRLHTLSFYNCNSLEGRLICDAIDTLPNLKTLRLDGCPVSMWEFVPLILNELPHLEELSLSDYNSIKFNSKPLVNIDFCKSLSKMTELRVLNLSYNIYITDAIVKTVAQTCSKLESLNVSGCIVKKFNCYNSQPGVGVSDEGILMICRSCKALRELDISYHELLTDAGVAATARCARLVRLTVRANSSLTAAPFAAVLDACAELQLLDVCGDGSVSAHVLLEAATAALARTPRPLMLRIGGTEIGEIAESYPSHKLLVVSTEDLTSKHLWPADLMDHVFDDSSEYSSDDDII
ncbi:F-box/LRR-repeat protein 7-like [Cydia strobilella]|uniref:F-box/LRR-repeat protein 7-like n=1 Tax=Cydia strobilella TaxID=1100964 RepID=UPI0030063FED